MEGRNKYAPSKTALTVADLKDKLKEATDSLKLARELLKAKEEENRQLKLIILRMTEQGVADGKSDSR